MKARRFYAYVYAGGVVKFGSRVPRGAIAVANVKVKSERRDRKKLRDEVSVLCRLAYDGKTALVPGIPEATDQRAGIDALQAFLKWARPIWHKHGLNA